MVALIVILVLIGLAETIYLITTRWRKAKLACLPGWNCDFVLGSTYGRLFFGIKNDVVGFLFYLLVLIVIGALLLNIGPRENIILGLRAMLIAGAAMSVMLTFIQWRMLKAWCSWCVLSALVNWGMAIAGFFL